MCKRDKNSSFGTHRLDQDVENDRGVSDNKKLRSIIDCEWAIEVQADGSEIIS